MTTSISSMITKEAKFAVGGLGRLDISKASRGLSFISRGRSYRKTVAIRTHSIQNTKCFAKMMENAGEVWSQTKISIQIWPSFRKTKILLALWLSGYQAGNNVDIDMAGLYFT